MVEREFKVRQNTADWGSVSEILLVYMDLICANDLGFNVDIGELR